ncbi:MAG: hypothetical protein ABIW19_19435 [Vicinamibacterales bacterium]
MHVVVYDRSRDGYIAANEMAIPSWSGAAKLSFEDVLGAGTDWLAIDTVGMHGTGIFQRALLVVAWDGTSFRTVAAESLGYRCSRPTAPADYELQVTHSFATTSGSRTLQLQYDLTRDKQAIGRWCDSLRWNAAQFAFVPVPPTVDVSNPMIEGIRERIARVRDYAITRPLDPIDGSNRWLGDSGMMNVLDPVCVQ